MKAFMTKVSGHLVPADDAATQAIASIKNGATFTVEIKQPRNINMHRLYFALVGIVHDNIDHDRYPTREDLHQALKVSVGIRTRFEMADGTVVMVPGSIAFHKMGQVEFADFFQRVCDAVAKHFLPGVTSEELRNEVETLIGIRSPRPDPMREGVAA